MVLLRRGRDRLEVLLTRRASAMRFGGDLWVFPGGRLDPGDDDYAAAAVRETLEETGITLDRDTLIPLTRWVTPINLPQRYDARFFAAMVGLDTEVSTASAEVAAVRWLRPADALAEAARGDLAIWQPTFVTLQQLDGLDGQAAIEAAFAPGNGADRPSFEATADGITRVEQPWAAGIEGRTSPGWLVGRRSWVVVNPADPTAETVEAILGEAARAGAEIAAVALTDLSPEHHAGVEMFAAGLGLPVVAGAGVPRAAPYPVIELAAGDRVPFGDATITARPRPQTGRSVAGSVAFEVAGHVIGPDDTFDSAG